MTDKELKQPKGVKFGDLNAIRQQYVTRAALTLTGIGLVGAAAGSIGQLLPETVKVFPGTRHPVLVYAAAVSLTLASVPALFVVQVHKELRSLLFTHLSLHDGHPDAVPPKLKEEYLNAIRYDTTMLNQSHRLLIVGAICLALHAYAIVLYPIITKPEEFIKYPLAYYYIAVIGGMILFLYMVVEYIFFLLDRWRKRRKARRT